MNQIPSLIIECSLCLRPPGMEISMSSSFHFRNRNFAGSCNPQMLSELTKIKGEHAKVISADIKTFRSKCDPIVPTIEYWISRHQRKLQNIICVLNL